MAENPGCLRKQHRKFSCSLVQKGGIFVTRGVTIIPLDYPC